MAGSTFLIIPAILISLTFPQSTVSALSSNTEISVVTHRENLPPNFVAEPDAKAARVPLLFYQHLDRHEVNKALSLMTPRTKAIYESRAMITYPEGINRAQLEQFHDITSNWGGAPLDLSQFCEVKIYVGVLNLVMKPQNESDAKSGRYVKRFFVVKTSKHASWTLFLEQAMSRDFVNPSWNLDLTGVSNPPGVAESQRPLW
ncbi:hypothetical protein [Alicyclobacillus sp. ALC3]|uniref:hypothetical protein n=1 Tax=Alicyclobacillus sp. ALC3 TaxID=2796143 RepID=UPI002379B064|nr:hypothetical protein [Alicyclobacillus sp. ALC3]WDL97190.1 hypothetical protein JC200_00030 [Alicyclobacillus sp. ALC3]